MKKCYTIVLLCLISAIATAQTTRYWVGPAGVEGSQWNNSANWSATSGGSGGASVPNDATYNVVFNQSRSVDVNIPALTLNSIRVTNSANVVFYTGTATDITVSSSVVGTPGLDIDAGSTLTDSITALVVFRMLFATNARGEIDGDFRLAANPALGGSPDVRMETTNTGVVVNVNTGGRIVFRTGGGAIGSPATLFFNAGSFLVIDRNGGFTPTANYNTTSTIRVIGSVGNTVLLSGSPPNIGNLEFDSPVNVVSNLVLGIPNNTIIKGNLRILGTNGETVVLSATTGVGAGANTVTVQGNLEISGNSNVAISSSTTRNVAFNIEGNYVQSGGSLSLHETNGTTTTTTLAVRGSVTQTAGTFGANSNSISASVNRFVLELNGTSNQNVSFSSGSIDNANNQVALRLNNTAGATLTSPLAVGRMDFAAGRLTTTAVNLLTINNTATDAFVLNNVSDNSFVNGPVRRRTNQMAAYAFPTGKGTNFRIIEVIPGATTASDYTAEYFGSNHPDPDVMLPLTGRSTAEYWTMTRGAGANAAVRLTLEGAVPGSNSSMEILVARYNGAVWQSERGSTGITTNGDATSGTVTSQVMSSFGPFTFGYGPFGALPIKLTAFDATKANGYNHITWRAECSSTEAIFEIERSTDGQNFQSITRIVADKQRCLLPFDFQDRTATAGTNYYRIKVIDVDQKAFLSRIVAVINRTKGFELVGIYPTLITTGQLKINVTAANRDKAEIYVTNISGQIMKRMQVSVNQGENIIYMDVQGLPAGSYQVTGINSEGQTKTLRFIKQ